MDDLLFEDLITHVQDTDQWRLVGDHNDTIESVKGFKFSFTIMYMTGDLDVLNSCTYEQRLSLTDAGRKTLKYLLQGEDDGPTKALESIKGRLYD